ncbi:SlyX protein [Comamonas sp. BIGb0124]|jgi:SlyX protein|uniref:SlyX family protein n=1 Tax=Comamonas sp. BIGb0124 TaxID=2485130 RepID=UPI000F466102|nr:SlyX family protein [Comamonas sp. BIGb0124]ROR25128.1 SlyX protein [Comamonas sp. BIGb0124]
MDINPQDRVGPRLDELEIKASYTEDLLDQLNLTIFRQQQQIDRLTQQVAQLKEQANRAGPGGDAAVQDPRDELPPHY